MLTCPFTEDELLAAHKAWGCNCGPAALAFALQTTLDTVRPAIPEFESRRYTSQIMMAAALRYFGETFSVVRDPSKGRNSRERIESMFVEQVALARIQWTGPWTERDASAKWACLHTHWIACWRDQSAARVVFSQASPGVDPGAFNSKVGIDPIAGAMVYDCNVGVIEFSEWESTIAPAIIRSIPRADGGWFAADVWRLSGRWGQEG